MAHVPADDGELGRTKRREEKRREGKGREGKRREGKGREEQGIDKHYVKVQIPKRQFSY